MKKLITIFVLSLSGLFVGCTVTPTQPYIAADRATKTAVDQYLGITATDHPELTQGVKDVQDSWELRLKSAESAVTAK